MQDSDKAAKFVARLVRLTKAKSLTWEVVDAPVNNNESAYVAKLNGRTIRLFRVRDDENTAEESPYAYTTGITGAIIGLAKYRRDKDIITLELLDENSNRSAYKFQSVSGLRDLFESASFSASNAEEFMDSVLSQGLERK